MANIDIVLCEDFSLIAPILLEQWDKFAEDGVEPKDINLSQNSKEVWFELWVDEDLVGTCLVTPIQMHTVVIHPYFAKKHCHRMRSVGKELFRYLIQDLKGIYKIQAIIGIQYTYLHKLCKYLGMQEEGRIRKSYLKNGELHDQTIFGITREEVLK